MSDVSACLHWSPLRVRSTALDSVAAQLVPGTFPLAFAGLDQGRQLTWLDGRFSGRAIRFPAVEKLELTPEREIQGDLASP